MKKWAVLLCALLMLTAGRAAAEEEMPQAVREDYLSQGESLDDAAGILNLRDAEGKAWCLIAEKSGWMAGYCHLDSGEWAQYWSGKFWFSAEDTRLIREGETAFRVESQSLDAWMRYESHGPGFALVSWRDGNAWRGYAEIGEDAVAFFPEGGGERIVIPIGEELKTWLGDFEYMAKTPEEMRARAAIGKDLVAAMMPGWTLGFYEMYNDGTAADAAFYRVENGQLTVSRLALNSEQGVTGKSESLAAPLSPALLERLRTEDANTLLDVSGYGSTFLTEDAWDQSVIPIQGRILENDLQSHVLLALTEREGKRYIVLAEPNADGAWQVRETKPLPEQVWLDLFHSGDDEFGVHWMRGDREEQCGFARQADGAWRMGWAWTGEGDYTLSWYGLRVEWNGLYNSVYAYGTPSFADLFQCDFNDLPKMGEEAAARLDTAGWAMVHNPNPRDRLHLRDEPSKNGDSLGKFYNGTPLRVLEEKGDWVRVRIGLGDTLEGWMMKEYLAFGDQLRRVTQAFPELVVREEYWQEHPRRVNGAGDADYTLYGGAQIIGIRQETKQWIVMMDDGNICLVPLSWFWEGNG